MRLFLILLVLIIGNVGYSQQLKQIQKGTANNQIPVTNGVQHTQVYRNALPYILDTLGIRDSIAALAASTPDSIYLSGDNVKLRDGAGVAQLPTASTSTKGLLTSTDWNTFNGKVGGSGVATRVAFFDGANTLTSSSTFTYNNLSLEMAAFGVKTGYIKHGNSWNDGTSLDIYNGGTRYILLKPSGVQFRTNLGINGSIGSTQYPLQSKSSYNDLAGLGIMRLDKENGTDVMIVNSDGKVGLNGTGIFPSRHLDVNGEVRIRDLVTDTPTRIVGADADGDLGEIVLGTGLSFTGNTLNATGGSGSTEYLDPYIVSSDTVGFILKNVQDTVQFIGVAGVTGESTTVSDSPTINMTLTGTNITSEVIDGSITPSKLSQTYLTSEVDGSTTNEIQTLSIAGNNLTISGAGGNTVALPNSGGSSEWASLHYGSLAANTQTLTSSVWNTINFTGSSESNASIIDANHTNDEIEFVVAGTYRVDYRVSFIANADALIYSGIYSSTSSSVDGNTQMESDTDSGYKHTIMQHSYIKTAVAGEKIKLQVQPLIAHTSVSIYSNFIVTKL